MHDREARSRDLAFDLGADAPRLGDRELGVRLVVETRDGLPVGLIAHDTEKNRDTSGTRVRDGSQALVDRERCRSHVDERAPAGDRREDHDLVAVAHEIVGCGERAVRRRAHAPHVPAHSRMTLCDHIEQLGDAQCRSELDRFGLDTCQLTRGGEVAE
jgi:hypothetical protein